MISRRPYPRMNRGRIASGPSSPPVIQVSQALGVETLGATLGVIVASQAMAVEATPTTGSDPIQDAINAILAMSPTVFRLARNSASYVHEDATNPGHCDQWIDLVSTPANDLTNATDASQPTIATVGSTGSLHFDRTTAQFLSEPSWGSSATNLTEALAFKRGLAGVTQYFVSRDSNERSWVYDTTNILKFSLGSLTNYVATSALDGNPHLAITAYDGTQGTPANRATIEMDGADDTHVTGTLPASLTVITSGRFGQSTAGTTSCTADLMAHVGFLRTLNSTDRATLRTKLKVLCPDLP